VRLGELLSIEWRQLDWEQGFITLDSGHTKSGYARAVPILDGDMKDWLTWSKEKATEGQHVFHTKARRSRSFDVLGEKPANRPVRLISSSTIFGVPLFETCAALAFLRWC